MKYNLMRNGEVITTLSATSPDEALWLLDDERSQPRGTAKARGIKATRPQGSAQQRETMKTIVITRSKVYRSRFATGPGAAWKWLYDITGHEGPELTGFDLLSIARRKAKEVANGAPIIEAWKNERVKP